MPEEMDYGAAPASHEPGTEHERPDPDEQDGAAEHGHGPRTLAARDGGREGADRHAPQEEDPDEAR